MRTFSKNNVTDSWRKSDLRRFWNEGFCDFLIIGNDRAFDRVKIKVSKFHFAITNLVQTHQQMCSSIPPTEFHSPIGRTANQKLGVTFHAHLYSGAILVSCSRTPHHLSSSHSARPAQGAQMHKYYLPNQHDRPGSWCASCGQCDCPNNILKMRRLTNTQRRQWWLQFIWDKGRQLPLWLRMKICLQRTLRHYHHYYYYFNTTGGDKVAPLTMVLSFTSVTH